MGMRLCSLNSAPPEPVAVLNSFAASSTRLVAGSSLSLPGRPGSTVSSRLDSAVLLRLALSSSASSRRAKIVSSSWKPSPRRAVTARPRLSFAAAGSVSSVTIEAPFQQFRQQQVGSESHLAEPGAAFDELHLFAEQPHQASVIGRLDPVFTGCFVRADEQAAGRSEERRVGTEWRTRARPDDANTAT